jgi:hypothetical protein
MQEENKYLNSIEHFKKFLRSPISGIVLFTIFLLLFTWPFVGLRGLKNPKFVFGYLFTSWAILIAIHWYQDRISSRKGEKNV